mmetsp:Transcript_37137/g.115531  ORF Transcript_37137/g.115531 Transcript_37137/m.115531 type:complete len:236 (-) Transcript_37137:520-1227(-)
MACRAAACDFCSTEAPCVRRTSAWLHRRRKARRDWWFGPASAVAVVRRVSDVDDDGMRKVWNSLQALRPGAEGPGGGWPPWLAHASTPLSGHAGARDPVNPWLRARCPLSSARIGFRCDAWRGGSVAAVWRCAEARAGTVTRCMGDVLQWLPAAYRLCRFRIRLVCYVLAAAVAVYDRLRRADTCEFRDQGVLALCVATAAWTSAVWYYAASRRPAAFRGMGDDSSRASGCAEPG